MEVSALKGQFSFNTAAAIARLIDPIPRERGVERWTEVWSARTTHSYFSSDRDITGSCDSCCTMNVVLWIPLLGDSTRDSIRHNLCSILFGKVHVVPMHGPFWHGEDRSKCTIILLYISKWTCRAIS